VAGGKVTVHFKVVDSEEYEAVDVERPPRIECLRWLYWCCGGNLSIYYINKRVLKEAATLSRGSINSHVNLKKRRI